MVNEIRFYGICNYCIYYVKYLVCYLLQDQSAEAVPSLPAVPSGEVAEDFVLPEVPSMSVCSNTIFPLIEARSLY